MFERMIFLGNGARSEVEILRLHRLVDTAVGLMSGLQQGPRDVFDPDDDPHDDLRTYVHWIIQAFGFEVEWHDLRELNPPDRRKP